MASTANDADLRPYPRTKYAGAEWLGRVPSHWEVRRLRTVVSIVNGATPSTSKEEYWDGEVLWLTPEDLGSLISRRVTDSTRRISHEGLLSCGASLVMPGSIAISTRAPIGHLGILGSPGCTNQGCRTLVPNAGIKSECLYWVLNAGRSELESTGQGTTFSELSRSKLGDFRVPVPPLQEQSAIASFLDRANARVDRYIRAKEKLIALLEEQKQAFIHEAVTGQIDVRTGRPYSAYKPSGTDWLGDLPAHWSMVRNGRVFVQRNEFGHPELPILEVSLRSGVHVRNFENMSRKQVMSDRSMYKRAAKGDIAYNMMRMWQGAVGVAPTDGLVSPAYVVARPLSGVESRYFDHLFRTKAYMTEVDKYSRGIVKDRNRLYWEDFKRVPSPCPPANEQAAIADAVDSQKANTAAWIRSLRSQVALARQYGNRLVADTVMGKLDVRQTSPDLHEQTTRDWTGASGRGSPPVGTPSDTALEPKS